MKPMYHVDVNVFHASVTIIFDTACWEDGRLEKFLKKKQVNFNPKKLAKYKKDVLAAFGHEGTTRAATVYTHRNIYLIHFKEWLNNAYDVGTLSHELLHVTRSIMERVGIVLSDDSEEAFTYTQGYLVREFLNQFWKK